MTNASSGGGRIQLSEWELANLHLPPVTTVKFYPGAAPVAVIEERVANILGKNPWLGGRLVKKGTPESEPRLEIARQIAEAQSPWIAAMLAWLRDARRWASGWKRARRSASPVTSGGSVLLATSRPSFVSVAR